MMVDMSMPIHADGKIEKGKNKTQHVVNMISIGIFPDFLNVFLCSSI